MSCIFLLFTIPKYLVSSNSESNLVFFCQTCFEKFKGFPLSDNFDTNRHVEHEFLKDYKDLWQRITKNSTEHFFLLACGVTRVLAFSHHSAMEIPIPFYVFPFQWGHLTSLTTARPLQRVTRSRSPIYSWLFGDTPLGGSVEPVSVWQTPTYPTQLCAEHNHWRNPNSSLYS